MPLYENAAELVRRNLEAVRAGRRVSPVPIGSFTDAQRDALNQHRLAHLPHAEPVVHEVVFVGAHIYNSRIRQDGYEIDDVLIQISSAMSADSVFRSSIPMQTLRSIRPRTDRLGNIAIVDQAIFECTARRPTAELFSVIPKGDKIKPKAEGHR